MAKYRYRAFDSSGKIQNGEIVESDKKSALALLKSKSLKVIDIGDIQEQSTENITSKKIVGGSKLALAFFEKLSQLCQGAMPIGDAVRSLSQRSFNKNLKALSRALYKDLTEGKSLSDAAAEYPEIFDQTIVHLLEAGESSANLVPIFANIIDYLEEKKQLKSRLISATAYPLFLTIMAFSVVLFFLFYMLPKIESMMKNMGGELTTPVKILIGLGNFALSEGPFVLIAIFVIMIAIKQYRKSENGRFLTDKYALHIPLIGGILADSDLCRITGLCSILFGSGVNTSETFRLAEKSIKNTYVKNQFQQCKSAINDGAPISLSLKKYDILSDEDIDIVSVGERTGSLVGSFADLRKIHYKSMNTRIKAATAILAGIALGGAFLLVFLIALGIVSSVLNLSQTIMAK